MEIYGILPVLLYLCIYDPNTRLALGVFGGF